MTFPVYEADPDRVRVRAAEDLYWMAHRWAVDLSRNPAHAIQCDAATRLASEHGANFPQDGRVFPGESTSAVVNRRNRTGTEQVTEAFTLPVDLDGAVDLLLGFAREYAAARPGFATEELERVSARLGSPDATTEPARERRGQ